MSDDEYLSALGEFSYSEIVDFSERIGLILDSVKNPTEEQISSARNQAYLELF